MKWVGIGLALIIAVAVGAWWYEHYRADSALLRQPVYRVLKKHERKLYGELTMVVTINHDGRVLDAEVAETSGNIVLDRRAQSIARAAGPFGPFSEAMRRKADQIVVVSRFRFTHDDTLETKLTGR